MTLIGLYVRIFLATVFLMSGLTKLAVPGQFVKDVHNYRMIPGPIATAFAWILPFVEVGLAGFLFAGFQIRWAAAVAVAVLIIFMIAVGIAMARGLNLTCSCFGLLYREKVGWATQARDAVLLLLAFIIAFEDAAHLTIVDVARDAHRPGYALGLAFTGLALAACLVVARWTWRQGDRRGWQV